MAWLCAQHRPDIFLYCFLLYLASPLRELSKTSNNFKIGLLEIFLEHFQKNNSVIFGEIVDSQGISLRFPMCNNTLKKIEKLSRCTLQIQQKTRQKYVWSTCCAHNQVATPPPHAPLSVSSFKY